MTDAIQTIRAMMPQTVRLHSRRYWRRAAEALAGSVRTIVLRRRMAGLRVSDSWLREHESASGKRQEV